MAHKPIGKLQHPIQGQQVKPAIPPMNPAIMQGGIRVSQTKSMRLHDIQLPRLPMSQIAHGNSNIQGQSIDGIIEKSIHGIQKIHVTNPQNTNGMKLMTAQTDDIMKQGNPIIQPFNIKHDAGMTAGGQQQKRDINPIPSISFIPKNNTLQNVPITKVIQLAKLENQPIHKGQQSIVFPQNPRLTGRNPHSITTREPEVHTVHNPTRVPSNIHHIGARQPVGIIQGPQQNPPNRAPKPSPKKETAANRRLGKATHIPEIIIPIPHPNRVDVKQIQHGVNKLHIHNQKQGQI